jgi:hypothetical protein
MTRMTSSLLASRVIQKERLMATLKATYFEQAPLEVVSKIAEEQAEPTQECEGRSSGQQEEKTNKEQSMDEVKTHDRSV